MTWNDPALQKIVSSSYELVQCFYHAADYEVDEDLLLVGIRFATIVQRIFNKYEDRLWIWQPENGEMTNNVPLYTFVYLRIPSYTLK